MTRKQTTKKDRKYVYYMCANHKQYKTCSPHRIREDRLEHTITETLQSVISAFAESGDIGAVLANTDGGPEDDTRRVAALIRQNDEELEQCARMLTSLYEDYWEGIVDEKGFAVIKKNLTKRHLAAEQTAAMLVQSDAEKEKRRKRMKESIQEFLAYRRVKTFDRAALVRLIREVRVHQDGKIEVIMDCDDEIATLYSDTAERQVI